MPGKICFRRSGSSVSSSVLCAVFFGCGTICLFEFFAKKKAQGFYYTETKKTVIEDDGKKIKKVEERQRYAQPDTGAIHLLLKNLDDDWHNDDRQTYELKKKQIDIMQQKADQMEW